MTYGGFGIRVLAALIDGVVSGVLIWVLAAPICLWLGVDMGFGYVDGLYDDTPYGRMMNPSVLLDLILYLIILLGVSTVVIALYDGILPATRLMSTPGKWVFGYVITDMDGQRLSYTHAIGRHAAKAISLSVVVGAFWPLFTENKQSLHDIMAKTLVVKRASIG